MSMPVLKENKTLFDALGISKWHEAGYTGSRGASVAFERFEIQPSQKDNVIALWGDEYPLSGTEHAYWSTQIHLQVAPDRKVYQVINTAYKENGALAGPMVTHTIPWILENKPDIGYRSLANNITGFDTVCGDLMDFCTLFNSAGNEGRDSYGKAIQDEAWLGIGAANYQGGKWSAASYSSECEYVDFVSSGLTYGRSESGTATRFSCTSNAAPLIAGMCALVNDFFYDKIGRPLSHSEMYDFIKENAIDIKDGSYRTAEGKDDKTGWGIFILPDPSTIDISKYHHVNEDDQMTTYKNGSARKTVYEDTRLLKKIGSLDPYEEVSILYKDADYAVVLYYLTGTQYRKVGFITLGGG